MSLGLHKPDLQQTEESVFPCRKPGQSLLEFLVEVSRETAPLMNDSRTSKELLDELYDDETGLPK